MLVRLDYFRSFWNLVDFVMLIFNITLLIYDYFNLSEVEFRAIAAVTVLVMWLKLFYLLRIFCA